MKAVIKQSAEAQAVEILRSQILSGSLAAGERLTEMDLAARLNVSRGTVRTALHVLAREGLVLQIPYTGWTVLKLTAQDAWELYTLRATLESFGAQLAAEQIDPAAARELQAAQAALVKASHGGNLAVASETDFALHQTIMGLARHKRLADQYRLVEQQVRVYIFSSAALMPDMTKLVDQHQPIVDAIVKGHADMAHMLISEHITSEGELLVARLKEQEARHAA